MKILNISVPQVGIKTMTNVFIVAHLCLCATTASISVFYLYICSISKIQIQISNTVTIYLPSVRPPLTLQLLRPIELRFTLTNKLIIITENSDSKTLNAALCLLENINNCNEIIPTNESNFVYNLMVLHWTNMDSFIFMFIKLCKICVL